MFSNLIGVNDSLLNTRSATSRTFELIIKDIEDILTLPSIISTDEQGVEQLLLGTENGKILFYESSINPILIDSITLGQLEIIKLIATNSEFMAIISESKILNNPQLLIYNYYDNLRIQFHFLMK